jgi:SAM-dependent methyltransferase
MSLPAGQRQILPCPVCGQTARTTLYRGVSDYITDELFDLEICDGCRLGITSPMPGDDQIGRYYSLSYRGDRHAFTERTRIALRCRALARQLPSGFRGRMLDIGCGDGTFAIHQKHLGWQAAVTEIDEPTLNRLRSMGIEAHTPQDAAAGAIVGPFDAVTCWHVLEHALRPDQLAKWIWKLLKPDGIFQVSVPNLASWQARVSGRHWLHLDLPRHRYHFDAQNLQQLLHDAGFSIESMCTVVLEYDWFGAIQSLLNAVCSRPNVLFEQMTSRIPLQTQRSSVTDRLISYVLAAPVAAAALPMCLIAEVFGAGATLDVTCRRRA